MPTAEDVAAEFVRSARRQLRQHFDKIEQAVARLPPETVWSRAHENENSIGNLLLHLDGNVRQWIVRGLGRAPGARDRAAEFSRREPLPLDELLARLRATLAEADGVLEGLGPAELLAVYPIQVYETTGLYAVMHVVEHFSGHAGQILWAVKHATGEDLGFYAYLNPGGAGGAGQP